jgi:hypothetical protein
LQGGIYALLFLDDFSTGSKALRRIAPGVKEKKATYGPPSYIEIAVTTFMVLKIWNIGMPQYPAAIPFFLESLAAKCH